MKWGTNHLKIPTSTSIAFDARTASEICMVSFNERLSSSVVSLVSFRFKTSDNAIQKRQPATALVNSSAVQLESLEST